MTGGQSVPNHAWEHAKRMLRTGGKQFWTFGLETNQFSQIENIVLEYLEYDLDGQPSSPKRPRMDATSQASFF